jgi:tight adherence protein B
VTGPLVLLAGALLLWPDAWAVRRARWAGMTGRRATRVSLPPLPLPFVWGGAAAGAGVLASTWLVAGLAGVAAAVLARAEVRRRAALHEEARVSALAEALSALAAELRAGRTLEAAAAAAAGACADEESGQALVRAVRGPAPAVDGAVTGELGDALRRVTAAALLSQRTGCSLAAVLAAVEDDLRARRRQRSDLRSATAGSRASALLLAALPVLALAMGSGIGADPWRVLTTTPTGQVLLVAGVALEAAGLAWTSHLVRRAVR